MINVLVEIIVFLLIWLGIILLSCGLMTPLFYFLIKGESLGAKVGCGFIGSGTLSLSLAYWIVSATHITMWFTFRGQVFVFILVILWIILLLSELLFDKIKISESLLIFGIIIGSLLMQFIKIYIYYNLISNGPEHLVKGFMEFGYDGYKSISLYDPEVRNAFFMKQNPNQQRYWHFDVFPGIKPFDIFPPDVLPWIKPDYDINKLLPDYDINRSRVVDSISAATKDKDGTYVVYVDGEFPEEEKLTRYEQRGAIRYSYYYKIPAKGFHMVFIVKELNGYFYISEVHTS